MDQMETVIGRLSDIEGAAVQLEEMAAEQKKQIAADYEKKTAEFDREIDAQTEEKLKQLNEKLMQEAEEELLKMRKETEAELTAIENEYNQNHKKLAAMLLKKMIGE